MLVTVHNLINAKARFHAIAAMLTKIQDGKKVQVNEATMFGNINNAFCDLYQAFKSFEMLDDYYRNFIPVMAKDMVEMVHEQYINLRKDPERPLTDYLPIVSRLENSLEFAENDSRITHLADYRYQSGLYRWTMGTIEYSSDALQTICGAINRSDTFNLVHVNCYGHENSKLIKEYKPHANLYAISSKETNDATAEEMSIFTRYLNGGLEGTKVSSASFEVALVTPKVSFSFDEDDKFFTTDEKTHFDRTFVWLRRGGLMVYAIPACFISKQVATFLARNLKDVHMFYDKGNIVTYDILVIMGIKRDPMERELDAKLYSVLRNACHNPEVIEEYALGDYKYELPKGTVKIDKFRGGRLDDNQMLMMFDGSNAMHDFWKKQHVDKLSDHKSHPLLPFSVGQLGLVLTSGCLDGVIKEGNGCSHAVKGRVVKVVDNTTGFTDDAQHIQVSTTTSNRVEISMFLPDGTYKCLA